MATKLEKPLSRELEIHDNFGAKGLVIITIYQNRIEVRKKGTSRVLSVEWNELGKILKVPPKAPARYLGNPLGWLVENNDKKN
jgi:hypothetical protein